MRMLLLLTLLVSTPSAAGPTAGVDEAAALLSRFEPGAMPRAVSVMGALSELGSFGSAEHLPLLNSLAAEEQQIIQTHARAAIERISQRERERSRRRYQQPGNEAVTDWLSRHEPVGPEGERLGRNERHMVAYTALVLAETIGPVDQDWRDAGEVLESQGHPQEAIQLYVTAALQGESDAYTRLTAFGLDTERLMLGVYTALPADHQARLPLHAWLVDGGGMATVRVFADRVSRADADERGLTLAALGVMLRSGRLSTGAASAARARIERSMNDPDERVSALAKATYATLDSP